MNSMQEAVNAKAKLRELLGQLPGINGIGLSWAESGAPCVLVNVTEDLPRLVRRKIPARIGGVDVRVETIGEIKLESTALPRTRAVACPPVSS